jgi:hypothetical protein
VYAVPAAAAVPFGKFAVTFAVKSDWSTPVTLATVRGKPAYPATFETMEACKVPVVEKAPVPDVLIVTPAVWPATMVDGLIERVPPFAGAALTLKAEDRAVAAVFPFSVIERLAVPAVADVASKVPFTSVAETSVRFEKVNVPTPVAVKETVPPL